VDTRDLVAWAEQQAATLLPELGDRWLHVQAVAASAREAASTVAPNDRALLVAAAWVHDIGYARPLTLTGFHPVDGARYVRRQGHEDLARLVAHHSGASFEAEERGLAAELAEFEPVEGPLMDALIFADMTTGPAGQHLAFEERIDEILTRYSTDDPVHRAISRARPTLGAAVQRTRRRLGASAGHRT
jgi:hypothetical protein